MKANLKTLSLAAPRNCVQKKGPKRRSPSRPSSRLCIIAASFALRAAQDLSCEARAASEAGSRGDGPRQGQARQVGTLHPRAAAPIAGEPDGQRRIEQELFRQRI